LIGIYKITNIVNNKCYIGQSSDLAQRLRRHIKTLINGTNQNTHLQNAYKKYGLGSFVIEIIEECRKEELDEREIFWIDYYKSYDPEYGYNKTKGGTGGNGYLEVASEEYRQKIKVKTSENKKGERNPIYGAHCYTDGAVIKYIKDDEIEEYEANGWYKGVPSYVREKEKIANAGSNNGFYGKKHTKETRQTLSIMRSGKNNWNYGKVIYHKGDEQKYINAEEIPYYESIGWTKGVTESTKSKISKSNTGRKMPESTLIRRSNIYVYNGNEYIGWRKLQTYLRENGYSKISEAAIVKLSNNIPVRGYEDLIGKIFIKNKEE
jgi:group I intron endonuclease